MTQIDDRPDLRTDPSQADPGAHLDDGLDFEPRRPQQPAGRVVATMLLLLAVLVGAGFLGYVVAGGRLGSGGQAVANGPAIVAPSATPASVQTSAQAPAPAVPTSQPAAATPAPLQAPPAAPPAPTSPPQPTAAPTSPPPTPIPPTSVPPTSVPPTPVPPTPARPTAAPAPPAPAPAPAAPAPAAPAAAPPGAGVAVRPGMDARQAQIEGKVREYFDALGAEDYQRAQEVCCTAAWRSRYPLEQWRHNFDGVTGLKLVDSPRYIKMADDEVVVDTDYTFVSGGARRNFTLRWTFRPVGDQWQADIAEASPTP